MLAGSVVCALPVLLIPRTEPGLVRFWLLGLLSVAFSLSALRPGTPTAWGVGVGIGLPLVVVARIIVDTIRLSRGAVWPEAEEHTLFPIEIFVFGVIGLAVALAGAHAGSAFKRRSRSG